MRKRKTLIVAVTGLVFCLVAAADPPRPEAKNVNAFPDLVGRWTVTFANGVVETCIVCPDGTTAVSEPNRTASGKPEIRDGQTVIVFDDNRIERWTVVGDKRVVEHYPSADQFTAGARVLGIAERIK
jgi:hypothetical protein